MFVPSRRLGGGVDAATRLQRWLPAEAGGGEVKSAASEKPALPEWHDSLALGGRKPIVGASKWVIPA